MIIDTIISNPIFQGGALLGIMGSLYMPIKNATKTIYRVIKRQFLYTLYVTNNDEYFTFFETWLSSLPVSKKCKQCDFAKSKKSDYESADAFVKIVGPGIHFFRLPKTYCVLWKTKEISQMKMEQNTQYWLHCISLDSKIIEKILETINKLAYKNEGDIRVFNNGYDYWSNKSKVLSFNNEIKSIVLPKNISSLEKDFEWFKSNKTFFVKHNIPYKRSYLFEGPPGNGKSTYVKMFASKHNLDIYNLNIHSEVYGDLFDDIKHNICLIEDIDRSVDAKDDCSIGKLKLSTLLNVLDGVNTPDGVVFILTVNDITKLPKALYRPGRIDSIIHFGHPSYDQIKELYTNIFNESPKDILPTIENGSFSFYKGFFLENINSKNLILDKEVFNNYLERNKNG